MTYTEMYWATNNALANKNEIRLKELFNLDSRWFDDIIDEIESVMELSSETLNMIKRAKGE